MTRYGMAIDRKRCIGCNRCTVACMVEHNLPEGLYWTQVKSNNTEYYRVAAKDAAGNLKMEFYTLGCQHCDNPACVAACPTAATVKREDGIVTVDWETCIGCKACIAACPYEGVRVHTGEEITGHVDVKMGDWYVPDHKVNTVEKCTFCVERIDRGQQPMCVISCQARARVFGDVDDPNSEISKLLAARSYEQLLVDQGTGPQVYFL